MKSQLSWDFDFGYAYFRVSSKESDGTGFLAGLSVVWCGDEMYCLALRHEQITGV
jgi:hypothetical protein